VRVETRITFKDIKKGMRILFAEVQTAEKDLWARTTREALGFFSETTASGDVKKKLHYVGASRKGSVSVNHTPAFPDEERTLK